MAQRHIKTVLALATLLALVTLASLPPSSRPRPPTLDRSFSPMTTRSW